MIPIEHNRSFQGASARTAVPVAQNNHSPGIGRRHDPARQLKVVLVCGSKHDIPVAQAEIGRGTPRDRVPPTGSIPCN